MTPDLLITTPEIGLGEMKKKVRKIPVCLCMTPSPFLADERVFPFLGQLYVASELRRNGNPVSVLDLAGFNPESCQKIIAEYVRLHPDVKDFGLTATTPQLPYAVVLAKEIRSLVPEANIILGGPHVTLTHTAYEQDRASGRKGRGSIAFEQLVSHFDKLVVGDGEMAIFHALDKDQPQIIDAGNLRSPLFMQRGTLDSYAPPARDLIDLNSYQYLITGRDGQAHRTFSVISQLGCPFRCGFCGGRDSQIFRVTRSRSIENVIGEIRNVVNWSFAEGNHPLTGVMFYDDELNVTTGTLERLCRGLIALQIELAQTVPVSERQRLNIKTRMVDGVERVQMAFRGFVKAELFTAEQAGLMAEAGFAEVLSGVESGSDAILAAMQKNTTREINSRCVRLAHGAGLNFKALMSIGHPGESESTIQESISWAVENLQAGDQIDWTIITQYPGSPYYDRSVLDPETGHWVYEITDRQGNRHRLWSPPSNFTEDVHFYKGVPGSYVAYVYTDHLSAEEMVYHRDRAEQITRVHLGLGPIQSVAETQFGHSMGQGPTEALSPKILRETGIIYQG